MDMILLAVYVVFAGFILRQIFNQLALPMALAWLITFIAIPVKWFYPEILEIQWWIILPFPFVVSFGYGYFVVRPALDRLDED